MIFCLKIYHRPVTSQRKYEMAYAIDSFHCLLEFGERQPSCKRRALKSSHPTFLSRISDLGSRISDLGSRISYLGCKQNKISKEILSRISDWNETHYITQSRPMNKFLSRRENKRLNLSRLVHTSKTHVNPLLSPDFFKQIFLVQKAAI